MPLPRKSNKGVVSAKQQIVRKVGLAAAVSSAIIASWLRDLDHGQH